MNKKYIITLASGSAETFDVPGYDARGDVIQRSCFGALHLYPNVPRGITEGELEYIRGARPDIYVRAHVSPYVESKRIDHRGVSEGEVQRTADKLGVGDKTHGEQLQILRERKLI